MSETPDAQTRAQLGGRADHGPGDRITVVIPHHGDPGPTLDLVADLATQQGAWSLQVVVVDDGSPTHFPDVDGVTIVRRTSNGGFGAAVNSGLAIAEHPTVLVLNSDLRLRETFLGELLAAARPWWPAVVAPRLIRPDGRPEWTGRHFPTVAHQIVQWLTPLARFRESRRLHEAVGHDTGTQDRTAVVDWVVGAAMLMPTRAVREVGGFDETFFMSSEEIDLQRRLRIRSVPSVALDRPSAVHVGGGSSDPTLRRRWLVRSWCRYAEKWGGLRRLQVGLTAATAVNLTVNSLRALTGRDVHPVRVARDELRLIWRV